MSCRFRSDTGHPTDLFIKGSFAETMRWILCLLFVIVKGDGIPHPNATLAKKETLSFYVMGDGPYGTKGRATFAAQLQRLENRPEFVVHVGDVHERQKDCDLDHYDTAANAMLQHINVPAFVLPGDADWYECNNKTTTWNKWSSRFMKFHENWPHALNVRHQDVREENFAFAHKGVLFVGLHVLYATVDEWDSWNKLVYDDTVWLQQQLDTYAHSDEIGSVVLFCHAYAHPRRYKEFYEELLRQAETLGKPILYLHGDTHNFLVDRRFPSPNILRVVLDTTRESDPTEVIVDAFGAVPFKFKRRPLV